MVAWYCERCHHFETTRFFKPKWVVGVHTANDPIGYSHGLKTWKELVINGFDFGSYEHKTCGNVWKTRITAFEGV